MVDTPTCNLKHVQIRTCWSAALLSYGLLVSGVGAVEHVIDQKDMQFFYKNRPLEPDTVVHAQIGDTLTFINSDWLTHNAYCLDDRFFFDTGVQKSQDKGGRPYTTTVHHPGTFKIACVIHSRMGFILQVDPAESSVAKGK